MASLVASIPLPLPLDSLLASSWTWLALSLATIATLFRALSRISFCLRRRPVFVPAPPSSFSAETKQISSLISNFPLRLQGTHKHRIRSKSTPSLQALVQSHSYGGLACPELGFLTCIGEAESMSHCLRKVVSASDVRLIGGRAEGVPSPTCSAICEPIADPRLGFLAEVHGRVGRISPEDITKRSGDRLQNRACASSQKHSPSSLSIVPPCFEAQFGWDELLETKLGLHWELQNIVLSSRRACVVKSWSIQERNLFDALHLERTSVVALNADIAGGLACIAQTNGGLSHWDLMSQSCLNRVSSDADSVSSIWWDAESRFTIAGSCKGFHLWDLRSLSLIPIWNRNGSSDMYEKNVQCIGNMVYIHWCNGIFQFCDLRKSQVDCYSKATNASPFGAMERMEVDWSLALWEKLSCVDEEIWDESAWNDVVASNHTSSSFTSRCVTLARSLSSSGR
ncbi:hypothetical protein L7F22_034697 [Adiantum nelumboides]|nr:hypothetical protein [Adiantum nelumboides]